MASISRSNSIEIRADAARRPGDSALSTDDAEKPQAGKSLNLGDLAVARRTSLTPAKHLTLDDWRELGERIHVISNSSAWWIGDWLVFGESKYPNRYKEALLGTALDYQTLKNYAWIARKFTWPRRRDQLSFQHHVEVAALPEEEQDLWLERAEVSRWSKSELRKQLRASHNAAELDGQDKSPGEQIDIQALPNQQAAWRDAASKANKSIHEWIVMVLDTAAGLNSRGIRELGSITPDIAQPILNSDATGAAR
jgi:hypothetical protein